MTLPAAEAIFLALADVEPRDRDAFLDERCGGDPRCAPTSRRSSPRSTRPARTFSIPARIPTLDMAAVDGPLQPGTKLGGFLVLHAIGSGGMGVVYAAQQDRPRRTVAIKVLRRGYRHPEILRRFEREAEMLGRLLHPGIAQVYAFHPGDRSVPAHLVMELVAGPPLTDYARAQAALDPGARRADREAVPTPFSMRTSAASSTAISSRRTSSSPPTASRRCSISGLPARRAPTCSGSRFRPRTAS